MKLSGVYAAAAAGVAGGLGLLVWWWLRDPEESVITSEDDTVPDSPQGLADAAGVSLAVYAHARAIASEAGGSNYRAQTAVGWTIQNYANAHKGGDVAAAVLGSASAFGRQGQGGRGYVSSVRAPLGSQLKLAAQIQAGEIGDPTGGATNFDSPREQDRELAAGEVSKGSVQVARDRANAGLVAYDVDVAGADFRFWGPA